MSSLYFSEMSRLDNEYRALMIQAQAIRSSNNGSPTRAEAEKMKFAAETCSKLANLSVGAEREHWVQRQNDASARLREISMILSAAPTKAPEKKAEPARQAEPAGESAKTAKKNDHISQQTVDGWFKDSPKHGFDAVSGMEDVKKQLRDCVRDVASAKLNAYLGMDTINSFFFYGLPGCGKTFIIKAFAHELMKQGYKYMSLTSGDIHSSLVGESEKIVERAFAEARDNAPCIMFIDEIDSVCRNRDMPNVPAHAMSTTVAFLNGYNSLLESEKPVIFIGATNYPNQVDAAMMDRVEMIKIPLPDTQARTYAFESNFTDRETKKLIITTAPDLTYAYMGEATVNYNYRDIGRLTAKLKKSLKEKALEVYGNAEEGVEALMSGRLILTKEMFDNAMASYHPSKKSDALQALEAWDESLNTLLDD